MPTSSTLDVLTVLTVYGLLLEEVAWQIVTLSDGVALAPGRTMNAVMPRVPASPIAPAIPQCMRREGCAPFGMMLSVPVTDMRLPRRR